jgi:KaiC/GvpD/RAD55 family RecA-like ATPase
MYELLLHGSKILDTSQKFVELNLKIKGKFSCGPIADEMHNKITFDELYAIRHGSFVLIQGAPGIGKSRLAYEICQTWKNKTDLQNYSLVILLQFCKKAVYTNWKSGNLDDLICNHSLHDDDEKNKFILELKEYKGEGVLIIFEGYDELPTEGWSDDELLECNQKNLFKLKSRFNKLSVFITTRSSSSDILTNCIEFSLQVEVLGFTDFGKDEFIDTFCEDSKEKELIKSKFPSGGQHVPLNMVILVSIFNNSKPEKLPKTLTELYDTLIRVLIQQHLKRHQQLQKPIFISNLSELPKIVLKDFEKLCKLAFNELEQNNSPVVESFDDIETLGLIDKKSQVNASQGGDTFVYDFLHQTIQEFLAAHHARKAKLPINHIHESFKNRYLMIRIFLAGLTGLKDTCRLLPIDGKPINKLTIFHQLLESGNIKYIDSVLKSGEKLTVARTWPPYIIPYDMFVLGQCISRSNCTWKLGFTLRSLTCEHIKMFAEGISTNKKILSSIAATAHNIFKIEYIKLPLNPIGNEGFIYLFTLPDIVLNNLNILYLNCIAADNKCLIDTVLKKVCQLKNLQQFFFHNNNIKEGPEQLSLIQELIKLPSLHHVSFSQLSSDECSLLLNGSTQLNL